MKKYRAKGKNIKELLPKVAEKLNVEVDDLDFEIKSKKKMLGMITKEIEILVWIKEDEKEEAKSKRKKDKKIKIEKDKKNLKDSIDNFKIKDELVDVDKEDGYLYITLHEGDIEYTEFLDYIVLFDIEEPIMENIEEAYENRGQKKKVGKIYKKPEEPDKVNEEEKTLELEEGELKEKVEITNSKNKMEGYISFEDQEIIKKLSKEKVIDLLNKKGIIYGIDEEKIEEIFLNRGNQDEILVAEGTPPEDGKNGYIEYSIESVKNKNRLTGELLENGRINFKELNLIDNVKSGDILAEKIDETQGEDGKNIFDEIVSAKPGKPARLKSGKNTEWKDENKVVSVIDGMVKITDNNKLEVLKVFETTGVNIGTGNIEFNGNVVVNGDVDPGYTIKAQGNIEVTGNVEKAKLFAEGDIIVMGSIFGKHEGRLVADGDIMANFVEAVKLEAGGDIVANEALMNTKAMAQGSIKVIDKKGVVLGGVLKAGDKIEIKNLGSTRGAKTEIELGENPKLRERLNQNQEEIKKLEKKEESLDKNLKILQKLRKKMKENMPKEKKQLLVKLAEAKLSLRTHLKDLEEKVEKDESNLTKAKNATLNIYGTCYPGSIIHMRKGTYRIKDELDKIKFYYKDGKIKTTPLK